MRSSLKAQMKTKLTEITVKVSEPTLKNFQETCSGFGLERELALRLLMAAFVEMAAEEGNLRLPLMLQQVDALN